MIEFALLSSGSRANSLYLTDGSVRVLVDCGLTAKETSRRLAGLGIAPDSIDIILVSHEHRDHVAGLPVFARQSRAVVMANGGTLDALGGMVSELECRIFETGVHFSLGALEIETFPVIHDAAEPVGFRFSADGVSLALVADTGIFPEPIYSRLEGVDALILESNHDPDLLMQAPYPWSLKQRIAGRLGHLSNAAAGAVVGRLSSSPRCQMKVLIGAHVSEKSNVPELVSETLSGSWFSWDVPKPKIVVAGTATHSELFRLGGFPHHGHDTTERVVGY